MKNNSNTHVGLAGLTLLTLGAMFAPSPTPAPAVLAGGPILIFALPTTINQPGSYCLAGNLTAGTNDEGIEILVDGVDLDLGGFTLKGPGAGTFASAIFGQVDDVEVHNGRVEGWSGRGVSLGKHCVVRDVAVEDCGDIGISVGSLSTIDGCHLLNNTFREIAAGSNSRVTNCQVMADDSTVGVQVSGLSRVEGVHVEGGSIAISVGPSCEILRCSSMGSKLRAFETGTSSSVVNCTAFGTALLGASLGIKTDKNCRVVDCTVSGEFQLGISVGEFSQVRGSIVNGTTGTGISATYGSRIETCSLSDCNLSGNSSDAGIIADRDVCVVDTTVANTMGTGIYFETNGGSVEGCQVLDSASHGIQLESGTVALQNIVTRSQGNGIYARGDGLRIQANDVRFNADGIVVGGHSSLVIDNRSAGNTGDNYDLRWGNTFGPFVNGLGQISGSKPQANFETSN